MNCPACGSTDAYVGFTAVECVNSTCKHFKPSPEELAKTPTRIFVPEMKGIFSIQSKIADDALARIKEQLEKSIRNADQSWKQLPFTPVDWKYVPLSLFEPRKSVIIDNLGVGEEPSSYLDVGSIRYAPLYIPPPNKFASIAASVAESLEKDYGMKEVEITRCEETEPGVVTVSATGRAASAVRTICSNYTLTTVHVDGIDDEEDDYEGVEDCDGSCGLDDEEEDDYEGVEDCDGSCGLDDEEEELNGGPE